jgi:hypothetical protein
MLAPEQRSNSLQERRPDLATSAAKGRSGSDTMARPYCEILVNFETR